MAARKERILKVNFSDISEQTSEKPYEPSEFSRKKNLEKARSTTVILCGVTGLTSSIAGFLKNAYRQRQRD